MYVHAGIVCAQVHYTYTGVSRTYRRIVRVRAYSIAYLVQGTKSRFGGCLMNHFKDTERALKGCCKGTNGGQKKEGGGEVF